MHGQVKSSNLIFQSEWLCGSHGSFPLGDHVARSRTGIDLLLRLAFWRMCQTLDEVCRAQVLLMCHVQVSEHPCPQEHLHLREAVTDL